MDDLRIKNHNELVRQVLLYLHKNYTGRYWENQTGAVKSEQGYYKRFGLIGSTDIMGHTGQGRAVYIEIKTNSGRLDKNQIAFKEICEIDNCVHIVVKDEIIDSAFKQLIRR